MTISAGSTGDLYMDEENPKSLLSAPPPPAPPSDVPPPHEPQQVRTARMADERPDGSIRDTSTEALRPSNDLNYRNLSDEEIQKPAEPPPQEPPPQPEVPKPPEAPPEPKVYAGKFKSEQELEKGYLEAEKAMRKAQQEVADLKKAQAAAPPPPPPAKTPAQIAAEQEENNRFLNEFVQNPKGKIDQWKQEAIQQTQVALAAQQVTENWKKANPDLVEHEFFVSAEAYRLSQSDPELGKDTPRLIETATSNYRQLIGKIRSEGAKEALTTETRTIPLLSNTTAATTEQPAPKAPLTADEAYNAHMRMLKEQEQKSHRGLRR